MLSPSSQSLAKWAAQRCAINPGLTFFGAYVQLCREYNHDTTAVMVNRPTIGVFELDHGQLVWWPLGAFEELNVKTCSGSNA